MRVFQLHMRAWAQFGGEHPLCQTGGDIKCLVLPLSFSLGFAFGEVSKIKVIFVTFCMKSFFMLDCRPYVAKLMLKQSLV